MSLSGLSEAVPQVFLAMTAGLFLFIPCFATTLRQVLIDFHGKDETWALDSATSQNSGRQDTSINSSQDCYFYLISVSPECQHRGTLHLGGPASGLALEHLLRPGISRAIEDSELAPRPCGPLRWHRLKGQSNTGKACQILIWEVMCPKPVQGKQWRQNSVSSGEVCGNFYQEARRKVHVRCQLQGLP